MTTSLGYSVMGDLSVIERHVPSTGRHRQQAPEPRQLTECDRAPGKRRMPYRVAETSGSTGTASGSGPPLQVSDDQPEATRVLPCFGQTTTSGMSGVSQPKGQPQPTMSRKAGRPG